MVEKTITSPCVSICLLNDDDVCVGCYRDADEIRRWISFDDEQRRQVLERCVERNKQLNPFA